jgi:hypothetical protein
MKIKGFGQKFSPSVGLGAGRGGTQIVSCEVDLAVSSLDRGVFVGICAAVILAGLPGVAVAS